MDADFSHDPKYLPVMLKSLETHDVAIGSRYVPGGGTVNWGLGRKVLSRGGSLYARTVLGAPIRDFTGGFNGWRRKVIEAVDVGTLRSDGYSFQIELKYRAFKKGFRWTEFPIVFADREVGKSKMNRRIVFEALARVWSFRSCSAN
jgi:dolichol-phosphate mannosyltransferase